MHSRGIRITSLFFVISTPFYGGMKKVTMNFDGNPRKRDEIGRYSYITGIITLMK